MAYGAAVVPDGIPPGALPADAAGLLAVLPDLPPWLYARSTLGSGHATVRLSSDAHTALVLDQEVAVLVGRPDPDLIGEVLAGNPPGPVLLIPAEAITQVRPALPRWTEAPFVVHALPGLYRSPAPVATGVVVSDPLDPAVLAGLPDDVRADAIQAPAAAVRVVDGRRSRSASWPTSPRACGTSASTPFRRSVAKATERRCSTRWLGRWQPRGGNRCGRPTRTTRRPWRWRRVWVLNASLVWSS